MNKIFIIDLYIRSVEYIADVIFKIGEYYGLPMTSVKFWRVMNAIWEHCFNQRVRYKIFKD